MGATPDTKLPVFATLGLAIAGLLIAVLMGMGKGALVGGVIAGLGIIPACYGMWVGMQQETQKSLGASLGVFFYLVMDIVIHWGVMRNLRVEIGASAAIMSAAIVLDLIVLAVFTTVKIQSDPTIVIIAVVSIVTVFLFEAQYLSRARSST